MLEVRGLRVTYGGIAAVKGIDFEVGAGELVCLIGANGAGKTSTLKALAGALSPAGGCVLLDGRDTTGLAAHRLVRLGLALVPEGRGIFARLTVSENLRMGAYCRNDGGIEADLERVYVLFQRLRDRRGQVAGTLSGGEQQMLAIGRALMSRPKLLLLDEPSMGLAPLAAQTVFGTIREIAAGGVTVLLVEQNALAALGLAGRAYVMESGTIVLSGPARALLADPKVRAAYLGEALG